MSDRPSSRFQTEQLTLRDELAVDRTALANERTFMAYVRTALGFSIVGLTFLHFLEELYFHVVGYAFMFIAVAVLIFGWLRFLQMRAGLKQLRRNLIAAQEQAPDSERNKLDDDEE